MELIWTCAVMVSGLWNVGTSPTASSRPSGSWHCPGEGSLWVYSKDSVRDGGSGHTLNSALVPHGVAVKQLSVGRLRLGIGRGVTAVLVAGAGANAS